MSLKLNPLSDQQLTALGQLVQGLTKEQTLWLSGYFEGRLAVLGASSEVQSISAPAAAVAPAPENRINLTILFGTETGHSQGLAERLGEKATFKGINAQVYSLYDYNYKKLKEEENVAIIVSTHGEGDPPDMAEDFHKYVTGNRAPQLESTNYSVLALGDKTYRNFCKTGEDIDDALKSCGGYRITSMVKCDVDYEQSAEIWMNNVLLNLTPAEAPAASGSATPAAPAPATAVNGAAVVGETFSKNNPYMATVLDKVKITGRDSDKEVYHVELSLEGSGLEYEPGDSLGIFAHNPTGLVEAIFEQTGFDPEQQVDFGEDKIGLKEALSYHLEITTLTYDLLEKYYDKTKNADLLKILEDEDALNDYLYGHDVLDLLEDFPFKWNANKLVSILRPVPPRLYSISSSMESVGEEVHATISVVRYERKNRTRKGACSSYLSDGVEVDDQIPVYIEKNPAFKLPLNGSKIIMVGAGTGVAPYRAFMQHRESQGMKGNTWLFFGDRRFSSDFLYQAEWQKLLKSEHLERMDVAFSRDQEEKVYVQHRLKENQKEVFEWLENGAYLYLCGDMKHMAKDVNKALLEIVQAQGGISQEQAEKYIKNLKREKRFQTDVY
ncbi:assimilatory sulfite reductase (NADPH) flavoprotein subunit [Maribellus sp. CM-23]|uniref:assimilatory sulfite reductase (NADPH) flavoprotein subunit n=1 Tax=Maribellus sp. CM-23 TaxID=2781026 RepID=UPI001F36E628|nr:assimilatory sulfite reductase (NADPH) flavoprotein subunit [Maribellus sp. CM-23]MCE4565627.1 assimilatory sulfite reductase (NADPH) flavoprotein subunit [Maribellus sp. CM-23]